MKNKFEEYLINMSATPTKEKAHTAQDKTPQPTGTKCKPGRLSDLKAIENFSGGSEGCNGPDVSTDGIITNTKNAERVIERRKSTRKSSPLKNFRDFVTESLVKGKRKSVQKRPKSAGVKKAVHSESKSDNEGEGDDSQFMTVVKPDSQDLQLLQEDVVAGKNMFGFNTPKKRDGMAQAALNTPKTPKTPKTTSAIKKVNYSTKTLEPKRHKAVVESKTPTHLRQRVKNQIAKLMVASSDSDFSADESDFLPSDSESSSNSSASLSDAGADDDEPKTPHKSRRSIVVPLLPKTPSAARLRQSERVKKSTSDYVPESDGYFQSHSNKKIMTSDHTLDRLKNPRLSADHVFSLLAEIKLSTEHEISMKSVQEEYRSYFSKWLFILNEGFNLLLYGLGSKRQLLQRFHHDVLAQQTVLVVNGFFPSLTLKDILDSITVDILEIGASPANPHEAVDIIEEELALTPKTHLYLIIHNLDGTMLRNAKAQAILARLAKVPNIHLVASIDHINTPLLWDHTKLSNFNFSWWDCTTMLPYTDETAFENSLLVQHSGELALSSMRSVFSSLTVNARGIYMLIVKYQLKSKTNPNYQGMPFKDLYWSCREAFLVSSDLALRAQLTEFLDHKLVKSKRNIDGSEQLTIPIEATLLQQFLEENEKK